MPDKLEDAVEQQFSSWRETVLAFEEKLNKFKPNEALEFDFKGLILAGQKVSQEEMGYEKMLGHFAEYDYNLFLIHKIDNVDRVCELEQKYRNIYRKAEEILGERVIEITSYRGMINNGPINTVQTSAKVKAE